MEYNQESQRYQLHDLARLVAYSRLDEATRVQVQLRHAQHFRDVILIANGLYLEGGDRMMAGLTLFDDEWSNTDILPESTPESDAAFKARLPIGRFAETREIAPTAVLLASSDGDYYVGATLSPNGGDVMF